MSIANILFPNVTETVEDIQKKYPPRSVGTTVTRFAPSPTGFLHVGGIYSSLISERFAHQNNGIFMLRIEDTDQKRLVAGTIDLIIDGLKKFGLNVDEGPIGLENSDIGNYGPYIQSHRKEIYATFAKWLLENGKAYPCFLTAEEIDEIREIQTKSTIPPGIYGKYSPYRSADPKEIEKKLSEGVPFVIRFFSPSNPTQKVTLHDEVRGQSIVGDNFVDHVLLKSDGLPTYHFAHVIDDFLMGTTHVIRGEERFASYPLHKQLFEAFNFPLPVFCHISPIMKLDDGKKRKLSKRHDPEANIEFFFEHGYNTQAILSYLMNIADPFFEERQTNNPTNTYSDYPIKLNTMNPAGALLDFDKLNFVSKEYLATLANEKLFEQTLEWATKYSPAFAEVMKKNNEYCLNVISIERGGEKDPKRFTTYKDIQNQSENFFDEIYENKKSLIKSLLPSEIPTENITTFLTEYQENLGLQLSKEDRFTNLKSIAQKHGFAQSNADFKNGGYIGKIGDAAMILRIFLLLSKVTPDLYESMNVMGEERVKRRLEV